MEERYSRNIPAVSEEEMGILKKSHVLVLGCGGLGGYVIEYLARLGVGQITCVDGDSFTESNLNRQILSSVGNLGKNKAEEAAKRAAAINPEISVISIPEYITAENAGQIVAGIDVVIDALDNVEARLITEDAAEKAGIPMIHGAIEGWDAQCMIVSPGSRMLHELYSDKKGGFSKTSLPMTAAFCAAMECALSVKVLLHREFQAGKLYISSLDSMYLEEIPLS